MQSDMNKSTVLVVDDAPENIDVLTGVLEDEYQIKVALNGSKALQLSREHPLPDLILLDIMMPGMDGYETCHRLKSDPQTLDIPVIFVTAMTEIGDEAKGLKMGAVDYVTKPIEPELLKMRVRNMIDLKRHRDRLEEMVLERTFELRLTQEVTIGVLADLAETRDPETGGHIKRTQHYVRLLAEYLSKKNGYSWYLNDKTIDLLFLSAPLHDVGKVGVPDNILLKPGKLTKNEFGEMRMHTVYGAKAMQIAEERLGNNSFLNLAGEIACTHHEKWDGSGYPSGLSGEDIPISGRLMAVADVYDALVTRRVYKPPFDEAEAVRIITGLRGSHMDPNVVDAFLELREGFRATAVEYADSEEELAAVSDRSLAPF